MYGVLILCGKRIPNRGPLLREEQVILMPNWLRHRVRIPLKLRHLGTFRPSALDLILTKMARADENDLADIRFLLSREPLTAERLKEAFTSARVPNVPEIRELFQRAQTKVLEFA